MRKSYLRVHFRRYGGSESGVVAGMKTEIEINEEQMQALEYYCSLAHVSRDKVIRQALSIFLPAKPRLHKGSLREHPAFGSWKARQVDAVTYLQALRAECQEL